jgi:hypothetical protein
VLLLGMHVLKPEIAPSWRFISEYALGDFGWLMHLAFLAFAGAHLGLVTPRRAPQSPERDRHRAK